MKKLNKNKIFLQQFAVFYRLQFDNGEFDDILR